jgi:hypothetical protein
MLTYDGDVASYYTVSGSLHEVRYCIVADCRKDQERGIHSMYELGHKSPMDYGKISLERIG